MIDEIKKLIKGDVFNDEETLKKYSRDASIFTVKPEMVIYPQDAEDIKQIVRFVARNKPAYPTLSITARSAGTCMSGGSINESIIIDFTKYMHGISEFKEESFTHYGIKMSGSVKLLPGTYYRDVEKFTKEHGMIMPTYTASKDLCAVGGMVSNNAGGEKTIRYGKTENFIKEMKVIFRDGNEYIVKPLDKQELNQKCEQKDFEGEIYSEIRKLINDNLDQIKNSKPNVSKNSAGYYLWNVYDENTGVFDLCRLIVGSQGTLGIVTEVTWCLVQIEKYSAIHVTFMKDLSHLGQVVDEILPLKPESIESYDDYSLSLAVKFFPDFIRQMNIFKFIRLGLSFIPEAFMLIRGGMPKLVLITEFTGTDEASCFEKAKELDINLKKFGFRTRITNAREGEKYWKIRRESFNLLRKHVKGKHTAPFIDDVCVSPYVLPEFLPKLNTILNQYKLVYTIAGHAGNGNFHIIPLMDFKDPKTREIILELSDKVYALVHEYKGSITAEHNDGLVRTPYLSTMFKPEVISLFKQTKDIFDPLNIFNPNKKVGATIEYMREHIVLEKPTSKHSS